jgi:hypothetical protein
MYVYDVHNVCRLGKTDDDDDDAACHFREKRNSLFIISTKNVGKEPVSK